MQLKPGDRVAIVAPASQFRGADRPLLQRAAELLESWGLQVNIAVEDGHHFYLAGPDVARAKHITSALLDPDVRAVFCTRGGYGSLRLLDRLQHAVTPTPKLLVGYSDITALHLQAAAHWPQIRLLHGPNVATQQLVGDTDAAQFNRQALRQVLFAATGELSEPIQFLNSGVSSGPLVGGCLSMVVSTVGTPYEVRARGCILFLEDTGEAPYRIDRMITQLRLAGTLDGIRGIVFGVMRGCDDPYNDLRAVIKDLLSDMAFPIGYGLKSGHGDINLTLRLGEQALLDSTSGRIVLRW